MNLKSSQINLVTGIKTSFTHNPARGRVARPRPRPGVGAPAHARPQPPCCCRTEKPGSKANDSFLLGERLGVSPGPGSPHSADTRARRASSGFPSCRWAQPRLHLPQWSCPSRWRGRESRAELQESSLMNVQCWYQKLNTNSSQKKISTACGI